MTKEDLSSGAAEIAGRVYIKPVGLKFHTLQVLKKVFNISFKMCLQLCSLRYVILLQTKILRRSVSGGLP